MHSLEISHYQVVFTQGIWNLESVIWLQVSFSHEKWLRNVIWIWKPSPKFPLLVQDMLLITKCCGKKYIINVFFTVNPLHWYHILHCRFSGFGLVVGPQLLAPFSFSLVLRLTLMFLLDVCCRNSKSNNAVIMIVKCYVTEKTICRAWTIDSPW